MKSLSTLLVAGLLALAGCGDDEAPAPGGQQSTGAAMKQEDGSGAAMEKDDGTTVTVGRSEFGEMLFDANKQAIYIFEKDPQGEAVCYGECAEAWPPVFTDGAAVAGKGVKASLLGKVKRRDGKLQVTYAGKPLYYYAHESPGEVRCHNVSLNGGLWWVVGPNGKRRP
jgi:predicted lipoprotein with Yx(FWY)xxD motif